MNILLIAAFLRKRDENRPNQIRIITNRVGVHYSLIDDDKQRVPASEAFENFTIRISDGSSIFKANLFGPGAEVNNATYQMVSFDAGVKYKRLSLEGAFYLRRIGNLSGPGIDALTIEEFKDNGFQVQASAMVVQETLQLYSPYSRVHGEYGEPSDLRFGLNWFPWKNHVIRWNAEFIKASYDPAGGLSLPYPVGANGNIVYTSFQVNF